MKRHYILPILALLGVLIAVTVIVQDNRATTGAAPLILPAEIPYDAYVAGSGVVEASTGNVTVGTPVSGIVADIDVQLGEQVKPGQALFKIDDRDLQARLRTAKATVQEAEEALQKPRHQLDYAERLKRRDVTAISVQRLRDLHDDVGVAQAELARARAKVEELRAAIERHTVRAPVAGSVLQLNMRVGEYMEASGLTDPMLILGGDDRLYLRTDIDQQDAWRLQPDADAVAFVVGNPKLKVQLKFEYIEPLAVPKVALTGRSTERADTRVVQVLYSFPRHALPVYVGQQMDVYIKAPPATAGSARNGR